MHQIDPKLIPAIPSLLAKSAYMFTHQHIRDGVFAALFIEHTAQWYTGNKLKSIRTNIPRRLSPDKNWAWATYMETLVMLSRVYREFTLEIVLSRDGALRTYSVPIVQDMTLWSPPSGGDIVNTPRHKDSLFMPKETDRSNEPILTHIIRDTLRLDRTTIAEMDKRLETFLLDPTNNHTFSKDDITMQMASIKASLKRRNILWQKYPRLLKLLGYKSITLKLRARLGEKEYSSIVGLVL